MCMKKTKDILTFLMHKDSRIGWSKITKSNHINNAILFEILSTLCTVAQFKQVRLAIKNRLNLNKVRVIANPEFCGKQMAQIRLGYEHNLTEDQIKLYLNPKFNYRQMKQIRIAFEKKLTIGEVQTFAKPELHHVDMMCLRDEFELEYLRKEIYGK